MSTNHQTQSSPTSESTPLFWCNACEHAPFLEKRLLHKHMDQDHAEIADLLKGFEEEFSRLAVEDDKDQGQNQPQPKSQKRPSSSTPLPNQDNTPDYYFCPANDCPQNPRSTRINCIQKHIDKFHADDSAKFHAMISEQKPYKCPACTNRFHISTERRHHIIHMHGQDKGKMEMLLEEHFQRLPSP